MAKIRDWTPDKSILEFHCPGCGGLHRVGAKIHAFNGNYEKPTLSPSVLCSGYISHPDYEFGKEIYCHSFVVDGRIQFLDDCRHPLKGQTVDLPDL